ncbi:MAG: hypothetical protein C0462_07275 [Alcanivorax sp.]|nr:hypothetical protein [Alcanivorax sp.]
MPDSRLIAVVLEVVLLLAAVPSAASPLISRSISIDGNMSDWYAPVNITAHPGQFSEDCRGDISPSCDLDAPVQSTGRDLRKFSYTWDQQYLYFYVERWASATNTTNWLFYLDENSNGLMEAGERILRVDWSGSNRRTNAYLCPYYPANPSGDPLVSPVSGAGDGYTLPGTSSNSDCVLLYSNVVGGSLSGTEMEARLAWSQLGMSGPRNLRFHISSSRGMNLPSQIEDNMDGPGGPGGGGLFPPDMALSIEQVPEAVSSGETFSVELHLRHIHFDPFSNIEVQLSPDLPLEYVSHVAPAGSSLEYGPDSHSPFIWRVTSLQQNDHLVLQLFLRATSSDVELLATLEAAILAFTGTDSNESNNQDVADIRIRPGPRLSISKYASVDSADPGQLVHYTVAVENTGPVEVKDLYLDTRVSSYAILKKDGYGPESLIVFTDGEPASGVVPGTIRYSSNGGASWDYEPLQYEDPAVTDFQLDMPGTLMPGRGFVFSYIVRVRN